MMMLSDSGDLSRVRKIVEFNIIMIYGEVA